MPATPAGGLPRKQRAKATRRLILLGLAAIVAYLAVDRAYVRILRVLDVGKIDPLADLWITWLAVFAGADRVRELLNAGASTPSQSDAAVLRVQLDDGEIRELRRTA